MICQYEGSCVVQGGIISYIAIVDATKFGTFLAAGYGAALKRKHTYRFWFNTM